VNYLCMLLDMGVKIWFGLGNHENLTYIYIYTYTHNLFVVEQSK